MKIGKQISSDVMVAEFLRAEIDSDRFGDGVKKVLVDKGYSEELITKSIYNQEDNEKRRSVLAECRGYCENKNIFENFPDDVRWFEGTINVEDLDSIKYIYWDWWLELTSGTRLIKDAVRNINGGKEVGELEVKRFAQILARIKEGKEISRPIIVAKDKDSQMVILEGHARLTAYGLDRTVFPEEMSVIFGFSKNMDKWDLY